MVFEACSLHTSWCRRQNVTTSNSLDPCTYNTIQYGTVHYSKYCSFHQHFPLQPTMSAKREEPEGVLTTLDVITTLFPGNTVRSQLYRQEPKLPRLPLPNADLVGTTAALFLQHMIQKSVERQHSKDDGMMICTVSDIQAVIDETPALAFLKETRLEEKVITDPERYIEYQPTTQKKRKQRVTSAERTTQKAIKAARVPEASTTSANHLGTIVVDEDDYD